MTRLPAVVVIATVLGASSVAAAERTRIPQPTRAQLRAAGIDFPLAPRRSRVDLFAPPFSRPTRIDNPLFPISRLHSAILAGRVDGKDFKTETTLLPDTRIVRWRGRRITTRISQYTAYLGGRIEEVALDHYAQGDDGSVWYLGEDVFNYRHGYIADTEGTWMAGREAPPALIMPAHPKVGDTFRSENLPGLVFEEVTVKEVGKTVAGPHGPVAGAIVGSELHDDGTREDKVFAPGYGEFLTAGGGDVEAMALAVPADALPGPVPAGLRSVSAGAMAAFARVGARDWTAAGEAARRASAAWGAFRAVGAVPPRLEPRTGRALARLSGAVAARRGARARLAALAVAQAALDLELRHRPQTAVDHDRFRLWARQLAVDARAGDASGARSDIATLEWVRDRFAHTLAPAARTALDARLVELRGDVGDGELRQAARGARGLLR